MNNPIIHPTAEKLQGFVEGLLDAGDRAVLESHLLGCPECQSEVADWRSLYNVLAAMPQLEPAKGFANRVMLHVTLPDPWYVRVPALVGSRLQVFVPQTTRGWAVATACLALPMMFIAAVTAWVLSKPYITAQGLISFTFAKAEAMANNIAAGTLSTILQSDVALFAARGVNAVANAGLGAAGALALAVSMATALSAWVLYQNLFRVTKREIRNYVSYSF
jgi:anti-sigma factor RsiW